MEIEIVKVEVHTEHNRIVGFVEKCNLYEFNNNIDDSLRVRMITGRGKGVDFHKTQVKQIKQIKVK